MDITINDTLLNVELTYSIVVAKITNEFNMPEDYELVVPQIDHTYGSDITILQCGNTFVDSKYLESDTIEIWAHKTKSYLLIIKRPSGWYLIAPWEE